MTAMFLDCGGDETMVEREAGNTGSQEEKTTNINVVHTTTHIEGDGSMIFLVQQPAIGLLMIS
jgi:hypothetical protein